MKVVTADQMRQIDKRTIESIGIPSHVLMERAGVSVARWIKDTYKKGKFYSKVVVIAGGGNNGGDGIVAARELFNSGCNVKVLLLIREDRLSPDCLTQLRIARKIGVPVEFRTDVTETDIHGAIMVDALFGTGLNKEIEGPIAKVIDFINSCKSPVISIDIPSGISSDTGQVMGIAIRADTTITFGLPKRGHLLYPGAEYTGRLIIENIGFPEELLNSDDLMVEISDKDRVSSLIPERPRYSHKGDYGHVLIVGGSKGKIGAVIMAARACMRTGAGVVTIGVPESLMDVFQMRVTEEMTLALPDMGDGMLSFRAHKKILDFLSEKADVLCIGPGMGVSDDLEGLITELLKSLSKPAVIDADGINSIIDYRRLKDCNAPIILTPHPGEMARLIKRSGIKMDVSDIERDRIEKARSFAKDTGVILVLKGVPTVTASPDGMALINPTGNPGMSSAGSGDVLTGMIGALIGQGLKPVEAAAVGVFLHGLSADIAASVKGQYSLIATDIIESIPEAFKGLRQ